VVDVVVPKGEVAATPVRSLLSRPVDIGRFVALVGEFVIDDEVAISIPLSVWVGIDRIGILVIL
jgi:hypothetical protein